MGGRLTLWWRWERGQQPGVASVSDAASGARWSSPHPDPSDRTVCDCERDITHMWWWKRVSFCTLTHITQPETSDTQSHTNQTRHRGVTAKGQTSHNTPGCRQHHPITFQVTHFSNRMLILSAGICVCVQVCRRRHTVVDVLVMRLYVFVSFCSTEVELCTPVTLEVPQTVSLHLTYAGGFPTEQTRWECVSVCVRMCGFKGEKPTQKSYCNLHHLKLSAFSCTGRFKLNRRLYVLVTCYVKANPVTDAIVETLVRSNQII